MFSLSSNPLHLYCRRRTPFHAAAAFGHVDCLRHLLETSAELFSTSASRHRNKTTNKNNNNYNNNNKNNNNVEDDDDEEEDRQKGDVKSSNNNNNNNLEPVTISRLGSCSSRKIQRSSVGNRNSIARKLEINAVIPGVICPRSYHRLLFLLMSIFRRGL